MAAKKRKRKKKPKPPKPRHTWKLNPGTRVKPSDRVYKRSREKKKDEGTADPFLFEV